MEVVKSGYIPLLVEAFGNISSFQ